MFQYLKLVSLWDRKKKKKRNTFDCKVFHGEELSEGQVKECGVYLLWLMVHSQSSPTVSEAHYYKSFITTELVELD